jgi:hypothetical protein
MCKNYFSANTGHEASDEYFKRAPIYCDSDILKMFICGFILGFLGCIFTGYFAFFN